MSTCTPYIEEGSVSFSSEFLGEFWYKIEMEATAADKTDVPELAAEVGTRCSQLLSVDNPVGEEVVLRLQSNNPRNFTVSPAALLLPPFGQAQFQVEYIPSSIGDIEVGGAGGAVQA